MVNKIKKWPKRPHINSRFIINLLPLPLKSVLIIVSHVRMNLIVKKLLLAALLPLIICSEVDCDKFTFLSSGTFLNDSSTSSAIPRIQPESFVVFIAFLFSCSFAILFSYLEKHTISLICKYDQTHSVTQGALRATPPIDCLRCELYKMRSTLDSTRRVFAGCT